MSMKPLRGCGAPSYDPKTGRAASAFNTGGSFSVEGIRINPSAQVKAGATAGVGGAPGFAECNKSRTQHHGAEWSKE
jgi:hypothetical protein